MNRITILIFALFIVVAGCDDGQPPVHQKGLVKFSISSAQIKNGRSTSSAVPSALLVTVLDNKGNVVLLNKNLELYTFGSEFLTDELSLPTGNYELTQFAVLDNSDQVIYASPITGSIMASLVYKPLPLPIQINAGNIAVLYPEVLPVYSNSQPNDFGYLSFGISLVNPIKIEFQGSSGINYDSAHFTLTNGFKKIRKNLNLKTVGGITYASALTSLPELGSSNNWNISLEAYHSSKVDSTQISYKMLQVDTTLSDITNIHTIQFDLFSISINGNYAERESKEYIHLLDKTGYLHVILSTDKCDPYFEYYILKNGITYFYYDKYLYDSNYSALKYVYKEIYRPGISHVIDTDTYNVACANAAWSDNVFYIEISKGFGKTLSLYYDSRGLYSERHNLKESHRFTH
ncbi:MAG: hypothetical protein QM734_09170 [Cyclobacteriaceae bacterium]